MISCKPPMLGWRVDYGTLFHAVCRHPAEARDIAEEYNARQAKYGTQSRASIEAYDLETACWIPIQEWAEEIRKGWSL